MGPDLSRRKFMVAMGVVGAGTILGGSMACAQSGPVDGLESDTSPNQGRIDTHHHIFPAEYLAVVGAKAIAAVTANGKPPKWSVADSLEAMDRNGIAKAIVSLSTPSNWASDKKNGQRVARVCNEYAARMVADHPGRFGSFAALPLPDAKASLTELQYARDELKSVGVVLMTNYDDVYLGDARFAPVMEELNRRKTVVFVHPTTTGRYEGILPGLTPNIIEFPHDTTRTILSLLSSGALQRYPDIRFIFSHAGGTLPYLASRIAIGTGIGTSNPEKVAKDAMTALTKLYYDTAVSVNSVSLPALLKFVSADQVLLGTDFPFVPEFMMPKTFADLSKLVAKKNEAESIERGNASSLSL